MKSLRSYWKSGDAFKVFSTFLRSITNMSDRPIETAIRKVLAEELQPLHMEIVNESFMHNVPKNSETHFKVLVVSDKFEDVSLVKRHRMVNNLVQQGLNGTFVHALSIEAKTPKQWDPDKKLEQSPKCLGGFGK